MGLAKLSYYRESLDGQILFLYEQWVGYDIILVNIGFFICCILYGLLSYGSLGLFIMSVGIMMIMISFALPSRTFLKFLKECWYKEISDESLAFQKKTKFRHVWYYNHNYFDNFKEGRRKEVYAMWKVKKELMGNGE